MPAPKTIQKKPVQVSKNFLLTEYIPESLYSLFGDNAVWFINPKLIETVQLIREKVGKPIFINNWYEGGTFHYSGFRTPECTEGAKLSQHRLGTAADLHVSGMDNAEFWTYIKTNRDKLFPALTCMENIAYTPGWVHIDLRNTMGKFLIVDPI